MLKNLTKIIAATIAVLTLSACEYVPALRYLDYKSESGQSTIEDVNSATYTFLQAEPAITAYRRVAIYRGWSEESVAQWEPFVKAVMHRESGFCYNLRRGAVLANPTGCIMKRQGRGSDSGFGQLISIHYKPGAWLCVQEGLCSAEAITATPWNSMTALVALVERSGRQPWCYTSRLRSGFACKKAPAGLPLKVVS